MIYNDVIISHWVRIGQCHYHQNFYPCRHTFYDRAFQINTFLHFTFMHLADAFIQSDLQCIQAIHFLSVCVFPGNWTHNLCAANAMLYHWATGTLHTEYTLLSVLCARTLYIQFKSLLLSHHHSTCALVSEILESMLQTVQKQFTYRQYILTQQPIWTVT